MHIVGRLPIGGAEVLLLNTCRKMEGFGYSIHICSLTDKGVLGPEFENMGIPIYTLNIDPYVYNIRGLFHLIRLIRKIKPHIVQTHIYPANTLGRAAAFIANVPVVIATEHGLYRWKKKRQFVIDRVLALISDKIIVVSNAAKKHIHRSSKIPLNKLQTIYNFIDTEPFRPKQTRSAMRHELGLFPQDLVIGSVGRMVKAKGYGVLIQAVEALIAEGQEVKLVLVGDGLHLETLKKIARDYRMESHCIFTGYRRDVADMLNIMDIFVLPTLEEGFGMSIIEAFLLKLPVIATRVDAIPEIIEDGVNGLLVPPNNGKELKAAIYRLIQNKTLSATLGFNGFETVSKRFSSDIQVNVLDQFYRSLLEQKTFSSQAHWN